MVDAIARLVKPLRTRIANLAARAVVRLVDDGARVQLLQLGVGPDETRDGCERLGDYGFTSHPHRGAEAVVIFPGGHRDHGLVVAVGDRRYRLTGLAEGEVALYDDLGSVVHLKRGGTVLVKGPTKVVADAPTVELAQPATAAALKGTPYAQAEATFLAALTTYLTAVQGVADPSNAATPPLLAAITTFTGATTTALSTKVRVG